MAKLGLFVILSTGLTVSVDGCYSLAMAKKKKKKVKALAKRVVRDAEPKDEACLNIELEPEIVGVDASLASGHDDSEEIITRRTNAGTSVMIHVKRLLHSTPREVETVMADSNAPVHARLAAKWVQRCLSDDKTSSGHHIASAELQHLLDRTVGKPHSNMSIQSESKSLHLIEVNEESIAALDALNE